jgi:hypothetical protein
MILVKASQRSEAGQMPEEQLIAAMAAYHEELARAGVLLDASGLQPSSKGWRIHYGADGKRSVIDGPFTETKELLAGYTMIQVRSREEALEWTRRFPAPHGAGVETAIEVRQMFELDDFGPSEAVERFRTLEAGKTVSSGTFHIQRSLKIAAPAERIHALINNLRQFNRWNPFANMDAAMKISYRGAEHGVGAAYDFSSEQMGSGSIEIVGSSIPSKVAMRLRMSTPMPCDNAIEFSLVPLANATEVTWAMSGLLPPAEERSEACQSQGQDMDAMVGGTFEAGLATLRALAEQ